MRNAVFIAVAISGVLFTRSALADKYTIKKCSPVGTIELAEAYNVIASRIDLMVARADKDGAQLTEHQIKKIKNQWDSVKIVCHDDKQMCKDNLGRAHGILTNRVALCFENHRDYRDRGFCELVDTLFHEAGHTFGIPNARNRVGDGDRHNQGDNGDRIYTLGHAARAICRDAKLDRALRPD